MATFTTKPSAALETILAGKQQILGVLPVVTAATALTVNYLQPFDTSSGSIVNTALPALSSLGVGTSYGISKYTTDQSTVNQPFAAGDTMQNGNSSVTLTMSGHLVLEVVTNSTGTNKYWRVVDHTHADSVYDARFSPMSPAAHIVATSGGAQTVPAPSATVGSDHQYGLTSATCAFTLPTGVIANGGGNAALNIALYLYNNGGGSRDYNFTNTITWDSGGKPAISSTANTQTFVGLTSFDGGTTWYGYGGALASSSSGITTVQDEGTALTQRPIIDFTGTGVTATDDSANNRILVTIPGTTSSSPITVQDEGTSLTQRTTFNFVGNGVTATDDSANSRTTINIPGASSSTPLTVQDEGTALTQRNIIDFVGNGVTATDDSANGRTLVTIPGTTSSGSGSGSILSRRYYWTTSIQTAKLTGDVLAHDLTAVMAGATTTVALTVQFTSTTAFTVTSGSIASGDVGKSVTGTNIGTGATIGTFTDSTHGVITGATYSGTLNSSVTMTVYTPAPWPPNGATNGTVATTDMDVSFIAPSSGMVRVKFRGSVQVSAASSDFRFLIYDLGTNAIVSGASQNLGPGFAQRTYISYERTVPNLTAGNTYNWRPQVAISSSSQTATLTAGGQEGEFSFEVVSL